MRIIDLFDIEVRLDKIKQSNIDMQILTTPKTEQLKSLTLQGAWACMKIGIVGGGLGGLLTLSGKST